MGDIFKGAKISIVPSCSGRWDEAIKYEGEEIRADGDHVSTGVYDIFIKKDGVIFGKIEMCGDRMDYWANHNYYIAIRGKDLKILGMAKTINGWIGYNIFTTDRFIEDGRVHPFNILEWRKMMIKKVMKKVII
jgi:hypothetical protein